ncbi:hypothetical protein [Acaryochloris sp. IP29b_bin.148]|uniref:hypothetical protein n=1 Tax=Acaryochloris sp. IP29b_bin.148 TaxID=2969218 RepID=UPI00262815CC|nr:hypothetical protein [Acaryochloris sp. IP29b_bin.148]
MLYDKPLLQSKPKFRIHQYVSTSRLDGRITGIRQEVEGNHQQWWYQLMSAGPENTTSYSWWPKDGLEEIHDIFSVDLMEGNDQITGMYVGSVDEAIEFVRQYGEAALRVYEQMGRKQEVRISF